MNCASSVLPLLVPPDAHQALKRLDPDQLELSGDPELGGRLHDFAGAQAGSKLEPKDLPRLELPRSPTAKRVRENGGWGRDRHRTFPQPLFPEQWGSSEQRPDQSPYNNVS